MQSERSELDGLGWIERRWEMDVVDVRRVRRSLYARSVEKEGRNSRRRVRKRMGRREQRGGGEGHTVRTSPK